MSGFIAGAIGTTGAAILGGAALGAGASIYAGSKAASASKAAARTQAAAQGNELAYLQSVEELPQQFREEALQQLGGLAGLKGGEGDQQALIDRAQTSPLYNTIMGGQQAGEEAILRNAAATGGLRSGNVQGALTDYGSQLQNRALLQAYNQQLQGLQGLAGLPSNANQIGNVVAGIGETQAQGQIAAAQAQQQGIQGATSALGSGLGQFTGLKLGGYI